MDDPELEAIRRARMAELRGSAGGGASAAAGMRGGLGVPSGPTGGVDGAGGSEEDKAAQQEEMKRQILTQVLDSEARERLSRIALVKPQKSNAVTDILIQMARSGQIRQRITEEQLILLLDQMEQANPAKEASGKITYTRKKTMDSDDDDWDL
ncbi:hypothetical protein MVES_003321 [Malassezia vespertilionis]|uniref:PDCD5-related protein n=1 Tax=Malassezia vespertilionis TaxID=2020962 RepID=A0A2N1J8K7_9BASI|nr:hypothetical protein MVES_003321 [Malassezia vespertilionis]